MEKKHNRGSQDLPRLTETELASFVRLADLPGKTLVDRLHSLKKSVTKRSLTEHYDADIVNYYRERGRDAADISIRAFNE